MGFSAIEDLLKLAPVQPLTTTCLIGKSRSESANKGFRKLQFTPQFAPKPDLRGHFEFGLKYDDIHLEWMARLFQAIAPDWIEDWLAATPTGVYARKTACLYEWLTGKSLSSPDTPAINYETLVDANAYFTASTPERNKRWKIDNNLPGTPHFCPMVRWTAELRTAADFDLASALDKLDNQFGSDLLMRSAAWLSERLIEAAQSAFEEDIATVIAKEPRTRF